MSDVSKTNEDLIAALRERAVSDSPAHTLMDEAADALEAATRERDAAVAAIERVQETLSLHNPNGRLVKEVLAALDEAPEPEPEWEYGVKWHDSQDPVWYHPYTVEEAENKIAYWPKDPGYVVRRRKSGQWEVCNEGGSKP